MREDPVAHMPELRYHEHWWEGYGELPIPPSLHHDAWSDMHGPSSHGGAGRVHDYHIKWQRLTGGLTQLTPQATRVVRIPHVLVHSFLRGRFLTRTQRAAARRAVNELAKAQARPPPGPGYLDLIWGQRGPRRIPTRQLTPVEAHVLELYLHRFTFAFPIQRPRREGSTSEISFRPEHSQLSSHSDGSGRRPRDGDDGDEAESRPRKWPATRVNF